MFEVGKKVICIKTSKSKLVIKGKTYPLLGIKKTCCHIGLDVGIQIPSGSRQDAIICPTCLGEIKTNGAWWLNSRLFAPYDDSLSDITAEELIESLEYQTV